MKILILLAFAMSLVACASKDDGYSELVTPAVEVFTTHTYYVKWIGDESKKKETLDELSRYKCWTLKEVIPLSQTKSSDCHEFLEFTTQTDIQGPYKKVGSSFMIEVRAGKGDIFKVQFYAKDKKKLRRILKPNQLIEPDNFSDSLKRLTFK
jgi:hypothetical protein